MIGACLLALALAAAPPPDPVADPVADTVAETARLAAEAAGLAHVAVAHAQGRIVLTVDAGRTLVDEENARETLMGALDAAGFEGGVAVRVRMGAGSTRPLGALVDGDAHTAAAPRHRPQRRAPGAKRATTARLPFGAPLAGLRVALSAGHGWLDDGAGGWATQRSNFQFTGCGTCRGITEDFYTAEVMTDEIIPLLQNMGAELIFVREPDHSVLDPLTVDDGDDVYAEPQGVWGAGATAGVGYLGDYRTNADTDPGRAVFTLAPLAEPVRVSLRFPEGANRTTSAVVSIVHEGGVRTVDIDQTKMGRFFFDLGSFSFGSGGSIELAHGPAAGFLIADVVKAGGGIDPESRKPWWQMGARSYVPFAGSTDVVVAKNDVTIRPSYAEFVGADVYVSLHANASGAGGAGSQAHGTSTYRYSCQLFDDHSSSDAATTCDDPPGSQALLDEVHASILAGVRAGWDPEWADRGKLVANFGELRDLDGTPGILVESGFFDNLDNPGNLRMSENQALHDPRWRETFARALVGGIARYLAPGTDVPPERPDGVRAINNADGTLTVAWNAVDGATGYRVSTARLDSTRGRAFDEGTVVTTPSTTLDAGTLEAGRGYAFKVSALNSDGEGFASQAVVARFRGTAGASSSSVLVVWAYDRRDAWVQNIDNPLDNAIEHGRALLDANASFDGALDEAVEAGDVDVAGYRVLDVAVGKDSSDDAALSPALRTLIGDYLDAGGSVIASGEEIGFSLVEAGDAAGAAFLADRFGATYDVDNADPSGAGTLASSDVFAAIDAHLSDGSEGVYAVLFPDGWTAGAGARAPLAYADGHAAAVLTAHTALFGAGLEAIEPDAARSAIFAAVLADIAPDLGGEGEGEGAAGEGEGEGAVGEGEGEGGALLPSVQPGCGCGAASGPVAPFIVALLGFRAARRARARPPLR